MTGRVHSFYKNDENQSAIDTKYSSNLYPSANLQAVEKNRSRSKSEKSLHEDLNAELNISEDLKKGVKTTREYLVNQPIQSVSNIFASTFNKIKDIARDLDSSDPDKVKVKKYGSLALAAGFGLFAVKSSFNFFQSLFSKDGSSKFVKFADAALKWVMTMGLGGSALGSNFQFKDSSVIFGGGVLSILLSQLSNYNSGHKNLLGTMAHLTGTDKLLNTTLNNMSMVPHDISAIRDNEKLIGK